MRNLLFLLPGLAACGVPVAPEGGEWAESEEYAKPPEEIWRVCVETLERKGWKFKIQDEKSWRLHTEWKVRLGRQWREGRRDMLEVEIVSVVLKSGEKKHKVRARGVKEVNDNANAPGSEKEAVWVYGGGDDGLRDEFLFLLRMKVKGLGLDDK